MPEGYTLIQMISRVRQVLRAMSNRVDTLSAGVQGYTLTQARTHVRTVLRDPTGAMATDADILQWLNEAITEIGWRTRAVTKTVSGTVPSNNRIPLGAALGFLDVQELVVGTAPAVLMVRDDHEWDDWRNSAGTPTRTIGRIIEGGIELWPSRVGTAYTLRYFATPTLYTTDTSQTDLPLQLQSRMVAYARAQGKYKDNQIAMGDRYMAEAMRDLLPGAGLAPDEVVKEQLQGPIASRPILDFEITDWLNEALDDLAFRTRSVLKTQSLAHSGGVVTLPEGFLQAKTIRISPMPGIYATADVQIVNDDVWHGFIDQGSDPGYQTVALVDDGVLRLRPVPATAAMVVLRYVSRPTALVGPNDRSEVPHPLQVRAIRYAQGQAKLVEGDTQSAQYYLSAFEAGLPQNTVTDRRLPEPMTISFQPGPFDGYEATHI